MKYFIIAGEQSGDEFAANLIRELASHDDRAEFIGYGGTEMSNAGAHLIKHFNEFSTFGVLSVLLKLRFYKKLISECVNTINEIKPDRVVLVDFPGFNLQIAKRLLNFHVTYCIPPKLWAWGSWRSRILRKHVDQVLVIFPFEVQFFQLLGVNPTYVGNPSVQKCLKHTRKSKDSKRVAFLPGSRAEEIKNHLPLINQVATEFPDLEFVISRAVSLPPSLFSRYTLPVNVKVTEESPLDSLSTSQAAIVCSGTATLETALLGIPQGRDL